jgi:hypothetical protein
VPVGSTIEAAAEVLSLETDSIRVAVHCTHEGGKAVLVGEAELVPLRLIG